MADAVDPGKEAALFLVLALMALAPGVLLLLVGLRSLSRMVAALLATEAEVPRREEDGESGRGAMKPEGGQASP